MMTKAVFFDIDDTLVDTSSFADLARHAAIESMCNNGLPLEPEEAYDLLKDIIKEKGSNLVGNMASQGTTPRQLTDLIGSLCDLTSGSGDKGTPIILIQGYFDNYTNN